MVSNVFVYNLIRFNLVAVGNETHIKFTTSEKLNTQLSLPEIVKVKANQGSR